MPHLFVAACHPLIMKSDMNLRLRCVNIYGPGLRNQRTRPASFSVCWDSTSNKSDFEKHMWGWWWLQLTCWIDAHMLGKPNLAWPSKPSQYRPPQRSFISSSLRRTSHICPGCSGHSCSVADSTARMNSIARVEICRNTAATTSLMNTRDSTVCGERDI